MKETILDETLQHLSSKLEPSSTLRTAIFYICAALRSETDKKFKDNINHARQHLDTLKAR